MTKDELMLALISKGIEYREVGPPFKGDFSEIGECILIPVSHLARIPKHRKWAGERGLFEDLTLRDRSRSKAQSRLIGGMP